MDPPALANPNADDGIAKSLIKSSIAATTGEGGHSHCHGVEVIKDVMSIEAKVLSQPPKEGSEERGSSTKSDLQCSGSSLSSSENNKVTGTTTSSSTVTNDGGKSSCPPSLASESLNQSASSLSNSLEKSTKTCSVKLVDIKADSVKTNSSGEPLKRDLSNSGSGESNLSKSEDEPNPKKARPSQPDHGIVRLKPNEFVDLRRKTTSSAGGFKPPEDAAASGKEDSSKSSSVESTSPFDNVEEEMVRLFGSSSPSKKDSKVTISPVRSGSTKDSANTPTSIPSSLAVTSTPSSSSIPSSSSSGSVTITKLSTGSSLSVESKDLKSVLSGGSKMSVNKSATENGLTSLKGNGSGIDITAVTNGPSRPSSVAVSASDEAGSIRCNKCNVEYSTKEARRLHTCNSILDQHYLSVENSGERSKSSSSPGSPTAGAAAGQSDNIGATNSSSSPSSSFDSASSRSNSPMMDQWNSTGQASRKSNVKLIKEKSDKLIIEGRPKLSVTKVSRMETSSIGTDKKQGTTPSVPKFKLSAFSDKKDIDKSEKASNPAVKARWSTVNDSATSYSGKLKIKVGGASLPMEGSKETSKSGDSSSAGPEGGLAFSFAGKPTYSPSRIEPSNSTGTTVQTKGTICATLFR